MPFGQEPIIAHPVYLLHDTKRLFTPLRYPPDPNLSQAYLNSPPALVDAFRSIENNIDIVYIIAITSMSMIAHFVSGG
jgi:hypothetical protein